MILTAFPVGFFAGLFGIGGGLITVPFLFFIFETANIDKSYIMHLAVGTSFSIIIPTLNNLNHLKLCLNSIKRNSVLNNEIIILKQYLAIKEIFANSIDAGATTINFYEEKDKAKSLGAKWDANVKKWFYVDNLDADKIAGLLKLSK